MNNLNLAPGHCTNLKKSELLLLKMQELGIGRNCRDDYEYIRAREVIEDLASSHSDRARLTRIATKYIGI